MRCLIMLILVGLATSAWGWDNRTFTYESNDWSSPICKSQPEVKPRGSTFKSFTPSPTTPELQPFDRFTQPGQAHEYYFGVGGELYKDGRRIYEGPQYLDRLRD